MGDAVASAVQAAPLLAGGQQMRGTAFQIGNLPGTRSLSAKAQFAATAKLLRQASRSGNVNEIEAAIQSVSALQLPPGVPVSMEVQRLLVGLRQQISEDQQLAHLDGLRRSRGLKHKVRRLWDVMIAESADSEPASVGAAAQSGEVSREGYRQMHMRITKAFNGSTFLQHGDFDEEQANSIADQDWADDVARFSGTNHITVWLDDIRNKFKAAAAESVALHGFKKLFARYDLDGSGELDVTEFFTAVRVDLGIGVDVMTDEELLLLFKQLDSDGGGEVDANEFVEWLFNEEGLLEPSVQEGENRQSATAITKKDSKASKRKRRTTQRATAAQAVALTQRLKHTFKQASAGTTEELGWDLVFEKYDDDGSGELELEEFAAALRQECGLSTHDVSDEEISELFGVVDADQSGAIDSTELKLLLTAELDTPTMTFGAFYASMFELVYLWSEKETEEQYILFMQGLFDWITVPTNGHVEGEERLEELPVFDKTQGEQPEAGEVHDASAVDVSKDSTSKVSLVANFKLRPLEETVSMVGVDGRLLLPGFISSVLDSDDDDGNGNDDDAADTTAYGYADGGGSGSSRHGGKSADSSSNMKHANKDGATLSAVGGRKSNATAAAAAAVAEVMSATHGRDESSVARSDGDACSSIGNAYQYAAVDASIDQTGTDDVCSASLLTCVEIVADETLDTAQKNAVADADVGQATIDSVSSTMLVTGVEHVVDESLDTTQSKSDADADVGQATIDSVSSTILVTGVEHVVGESLDTTQSKSDADETARPRSLGMNNINVVVAPFSERTSAWSESANPHSTSGSNGKTISRRRSRNNPKHHTSVGWTQLEVEQREQHVRGNCRLNSSSKEFAATQWTRRKSNKPQADILNYVGVANGMSSHKIDLLEVVMSPTSHQRHSHVQSQRPSTVEPHLATAPDHLEANITAVGFVAAKAVVTPKLQVDGSSEFRVVALDTKPARHERRQRRGSGEQSAGGGLTYVVPSRRRPRVIRRAALSHPDLGRSFDMNGAARSVRKAKAMTRSLCKAVEVNMWPEQQTDTVEAVLLRRRALRKGNLDLD